MRDIVFGSVICLEIEFSGWFIFEIVESLNEFEGVIYELEIGFKNELEFVGKNIGVFRD